MSESQWTEINPRFAWFRCEHHRSQAHLGCAFWKRGLGTVVVLRTTLGTLGPMDPGAISTELCLPTVADRPPSAIHAPDNLMSGMTGLRAQQTYLAVATAAKKSAKRALKARAPCT
jgi:hypothetical protein